MHLPKKGTENETAVEVRARMASKATELEERIENAPETVGNLANLWKFLVPRLHKEVAKGDMFFSQKELRFFKFFLERVGYRPLVVAACVVRNWAEYVEHCKVHAGAYNPPLSPKIEFLVRYINEANYIFERHKNGRAMDVVAADLVNLKNVAETREIATREDIDRLLKEIEDDLGDTD